METEARDMRNDTSLTNTKMVRVYQLENET